MNQSSFSYTVLGVVLLGTASAFGLFGGPEVKHGVVSCGFALAGGLCIVAGAIVRQRTQTDEATIRTLERRVFDLESELEARADAPSPHDDV